MHFPECVEDLVRGSLYVHLQNQHSAAKGGLGQEGDEEGRGKNLRTFRMAFLEIQGLGPTQLRGVVSRRRRVRPC